MDVGGTQNTFILYGVGPGRIFRYDLKFDQANQIVSVTSGGPILSPDMNGYLLTITA